MDDSARQANLAGSRVLVADDQYAYAYDLEHDLKSAGAEVIGPVPTVEVAFATIRFEEAIDAAILAVELGGEEVFPVADALREREVPFVFATGRGRCTIPDRYADVARLPRPVDLDELAPILLRARP